MNLGAELSKIVGGNNKSTSLVYPFGTVIKSPTTNSYDKCLDALTDKLPKYQLNAARKAIDAHDRNSFEEMIPIGNIYEDDDEGNPQITKKKILHVKGTYSFALIAHLKTLEIWVQIE